jgi:hypothetical protein
MSEAHRAGCTFGPGYYRLVLQDGSRRYCWSEGEVELICSVLDDSSVRVIQRDGYCLDTPELASPEVIEAEQFLAMPQHDAMQALGTDSEADYARAYRAVEDAVLARDRAVASGARDRPSIVIKKKGRQVLDVG